MFGSKKRKERRAEEASNEAEAEKARQQDLLEWCALTAREVVNGTYGPVEAPVALKTGERALYVVHDAGLVEPRRAAGQWQGGTHGVSIRVPGTKSMRYRVGATRGSFQQGAESPTLIDSGTLTITDQRAVFVGPKQSREWAWSKLLSFFDAEDGAAWTGIAVSNRQKMSGVAYPPAEAVATRLYLEIAAAMANGTAAELVEGFAAELVGSPSAELDVAIPAPAQSEVHAPQVIEGDTTVPKFYAGDARRKGDSWEVNLCGCQEVQRDLQAIRDQDERTTRRPFTLAIEDNPPYGRQVVARVGGVWVGAVHPNVGEHLRASVGEGQRRACEGKIVSKKIRDDRYQLGAVAIVPADWIIP